MMIRINNIGGPASCQKPDGRLFHAYQPVFRSGRTSCSKVISATDLTREASGRNLLFEKICLDDGAQSFRTPLPRCAMRCLCFPTGAIGRSRECVAMEAVWAEECARRYPWPPRPPAAHRSKTHGNKPLWKPTIGANYALMPPHFDPLPRFSLHLPCGGQNLAMEVRTHQLHAQGFASLEAAESSIVPDTIPNAQKAPVRRRSSCSAQAPFSSPSGLLFLSCTAAGEELLTWKSDGYAWRCRAASYCSLHQYH